MTREEDEMVRTWVTKQLGWELSIAASAWVAWKSEPEVKVA